MSKARILIIEDDVDGRNSVEEAIQDVDFETAVAGTGEDGCMLFRKDHFDVVLTDLVLPDIDGIDVLNKIKAVNETVPVIVMTAYGSVETSVRALKSGAYDYITKPLNLDDIQSKVARAVETSGLRSRVSALSQSLHEKYSADAMVAESAGMKEVLRQIHALASTNVTVLIHGESGTGKELVARALHVDSPRSEGPFVAVNCGAFTETLLESELFGHEKGAFTGATNQHKGAFERADGGTLFLDEIGDAPKSVQVKLLRVLEEREVMRVGGQKPIKLDVRLVSATNQDLDERVEAGEFREDLLYRLKVVALEVPPLRQRRDDIRPLTDRFIAQACEDHSRHIASVEPGYYNALMQHDWPGNVRQLRNIVESSVIMATESELKASMLRIGNGGGGKSDQAFMVPEGMTLDAIEKEVLVQSLRRYDGNRTLTAEKLGISRRTIQRKIKDHDLPF